MVERRRSGASILSSLSPGGEGAGRGVWGGWVRLHSLATSFFVGRETAAPADRHRIRASAGTDRGAAQLERSTTPAIPSRAAFLHACGPPARWCAKVGTPL